MFLSVLVVIAFPFVCVAGAIGTIIGISVAVLQSLESSDPNTATSINTAIGNVINPIAVDINAFFAPFFETITLFF